MDFAINVDKNVAGHIWNELRNIVNNECAVAGIMGNMYAISKLDTSYIGKLKNNDTALFSSYYIKQTDGRTEERMKEFVHDKIPFGLFGWNDWISKQGIFNIARRANRSVADIDVQLDFLKGNLTALRNEEMLHRLTTSLDVREASDIVLREYLKKKKMTESFKITREKLGQAFYEEFKSTVNPFEDAKHSPKVDIKYVRIKRDGVAVRKAANLFAKRIGRVYECETFRFLIPSKNGNGKWYAIYYNGVIGWVPSKYSEVFERTESVGENRSDNDK